MWKRASARKGDKPAAGPAPRWVIPLLGLAVLALTALARRYDPALYYTVLGAVMLQPNELPFVDGLQIPALIACWNHGVDVYVTAPCDPLNRTLAYSPLWLRLGFLPTDPAWTVWLGLAMDGLFFLTLALLPLPRRWPGILFFGLGLFSSFPVFALERGNMDVVMFELIALGGWCWGRSLALRAGGYACMALAGLLKFYPLVLFLLFLRERIAYFIVLCLAAAGLLAGFIFYFEDELREMVRNFPHLGIFTDTFGFRLLPAGLGIKLQRLVEDAGLGNAWAGVFSPNPLFAAGVLGFAVITALALAVRLAFTPAFRSGLLRIEPAERGFLVIGAALICGCFLVESLSYKGIHFLFALPGLYCLAAAPFDGATRRLFRVTAGLTLFLMWGLTLQQLLARLSGGSFRPIGGSAAMDLYWILHELVWWWVISVLLAILFCFGVQSPVWQTVTGAARRRGSV
jgi:hypothetical protein